VIVRCTNRLLGLLGMSAAGLSDIAASDDDWYANLLWIDRRKCLLLMHAGTLFPVFDADVRKRDLQRLGPYLVGLIEAALADEPLPPDALGTLDPDAVAVTRTASRSVLGFMNDSAQLCRYHVAAVGGLASIEIDALNHRLRRTLHNRDGYHDALTAVTERLSDG